MTRHLEDVTGLEHVLAGLADDSYRNSAAHGFHDNDELGPVLDSLEFNGASTIWSELQDTKRLFLVAGEIVEAFEELRAGHAPDEIYYGPEGKPEGVPIELADALIRIADYAHMRGINLGAAIHEKVEYNRKREHMHGKRF